ncbi:hypothetical protein BSKO_04870 [Bryopsis sp. KO-2023]|nr:hypothetical protein BSKO_04870 [Bryopsis sp. KO-2023]
MNPEYGQVEWRPVACSSAARASGLSLSAEEHRCTVYCTITHEFGNIYSCQTSGQRHVCDSNCDQRRMYGPDHTRCVLSGKVMPAPVELVSRLGRKRQSEVSSEDAPAHKKSFSMDASWFSGNARIGGLAMGQRTAEGA